MREYENNNNHAAIGDKPAKIGTNDPATAAKEDLRIRRTVMTSSLRLLNHDRYNKLTLKNKSDS